MNELAKCRFCGQAQIPDKNYDSPADADESVTLRCDCPDAVNYQREKKAEAEREASIARINESIAEFNEYCAARNAPLTDEIVAVLFTSAVLVLDNVILTAAFAFERIKARISKNSKDNVVFSFTYSDSARKEVL